MAVKIEKSTIIGDVLDIAPQTAPLFMPSACTAWAARPPAARRWRRPAPFTALTWTSCWSW